MERSVTTTFFFLQNVDRSFELRVRLNLTGLAEYHTTLDFVLVDTTQQQTYVITCFTFIQQFAEHFNASYNRLLVFTQTKDFNFVTNLDNTSFNTTSSYSTTTSDREYVLNRHQERFINITRRQRNPSVASIHQFHDLVFPLSNAVQCTQCRTLDKRSVVTIEIISRQQLTHFHFNKFQHFGVINHIALVHEYNQPRNVYLTSQQNVFASLRHRTISCCNYDDSTIHLSGTSYHVLYVVGVSRAVNVSIVTSCSLILYVRSIDSNTSFLFFRSVINLIERLNFRQTLLCQYSSNSSSQCCLTVVNVTNCTNVYVGFGTFEFLFSHSFTCYLFD